VARTEQFRERGLPREGCKVARQSGYFRSVETE
jgi:hypothetical protein